jgi:hypothetical protein
LLSNSTCAATLRRKATAHYCGRMTRKSFARYRKHAHDFRKQRFIAVKAAKWIRKRFIGSAFSKWRAEANEAGGGRLHVTYNTRENKNKMNSS